MTLAALPLMKVIIGDASVWLPFTASAFALAFAIVILGDAGATIVLNGFAQELPQSPTVLRYAVVHLATGTMLLAGAVIALIAMESRSRTLLLMGEAFAGAALATIVICEKMSLWTLPYLE
jgi:phage shock protein PspC (stress-responsive transcriptional regulator)